MTATPITQVERSLIGCLIAGCREETLIAVREVGITPDTFNDPVLGHIFGMVCEGTRHGCLPDIGTIGMRIDKGMLERLGGLIALGKLIDDACLDAHAQYNAKAIYRASLSRKASASLSMWSRTLAESTEPEIDLAKAQSDLQALQTTGLIKSPIKQVAEFRQEKVDQWRSAKGKGYVGIPSSLSEINRYLGGYRPGVMCVLGGYRGQGKSTLARQEALGLARKGYKVLLCSMEDPGDIAAAGIAGNYAGRSVFHLDTGMAQDSDVNQIDAEWADLSTIPLFIASGAMRIEDIETAAMLQKARHGLDFIIIDHIQFITPYKMQGVDRNGTVATYSQRIVALLTKHAVPGLILSQLSRDSEKENRKPRLSDLRDSGCIEQDARQVMLLYWDSRDDMHRVEIAKNNFGVSDKRFIVKRLDGKQRFDLIREEI
jgi:replicative DNA helicase